MIKQVYMVQVNDRFGYADTLEQAEELERTFEASYSPAQYAVTNARKEGKIKKARNCKKCYYSANGSDNRLYCTRSILGYTMANLCCGYFRLKDEN